MSSETNKNIYASIEGLRGILSFWIVAVHVAILVGFVYALHPDQSRIKEIDQSVWHFVAIGVGFQVDAFFMISVKQKLAHIIYLQNYLISLLYLNN